MYDCNNINKGLSSGKRPAGNRVGQNKKRYFPSMETKKDKKNI